MPRPRSGRVGHSAGVAEHRLAKHRNAIALARSTPTPSTLLARATVLGCVVALSLGLIPAAAGAQTSASASGTRAAIDAAANQWFAAQQRAADLDNRIQALTQTIASEQHQVDQIRGVAEARAVQVYEESASGLDTVIGTDPIDVGRRSELLGQADAAGQHVIDQLNASVSDLRSQRNQLRSARNAQARALTDIATERRTLDVELAALRARAAASTKARTILATTQRRLIATATTAAATNAPPTVQAPAPPPPVVTGGSTPPPDSGLVSPYHDEPFLVCTRARESNGDYTAVSPSGYYGAYQFAPTTWDVTAAHAGRLDLVGVLPSRASEYDQDLLAWTLYLWQGNRPWGGRC